MYLPGTAKTFQYQDRERLNHTPGSALSAGDIVSVGGSLFGFAQEDVEANRMGSLSLPLAGMRWARSGSATTFSVGDEVVWDTSAGEAIAPALTLDDGDIPLGICCVAKVSGQNAVAFIPYEVLDHYSVIRPFVREFDCEAGTLNEAHVQIPAWMNRHGLVYRAAFGLITEVMAGSTQDQGIITVEDGDANAICTLTPSDAGADAIGDIVQADISVWASATGVAWKTVAAGKAVQAKISQKTSGTGAAGKIKVYLDFVPLL